MFVSGLNPLLGLGGFEPGKSQRPGVSRGNGAGEKPLIAGFPPRSFLKGRSDPKGSLRGMTEISTSQAVLGSMASSVEATLPS